MKLYNQSDKEPVSSKIHQNSVSSAYILYILRDRSHLGQGQNGAMFYPP